MDGDALTSPKQPIPWCCQRAKKNWNNLLRMDSHYKFVQLVSIIYIDTLMFMNTIVDISKGKGIITFNLHPAYCSLLARSRCLSYTTV